MTDREPTPDSQREQISNEARELHVVAAKDLFRGEREIVIEHEGERYRLRITRRGRLILQK